MQNAVQQLILFLGATVSRTGKLYPFDVLQATAQFFIWSIGQSNGSSIRRFSGSRESTLRRRVRYLSHKKQSEARCRHI